MPSKGDTTWWYKDIHRETQNYMHIIKKLINRWKWRDQTLEERATYRNSYQGCLNEEHTRQNAKNQTNKQTNKQNKNKQTNTVLLKIDGTGYEGDEEDEEREE